MNPIKKYLADHPDVTSREMVEKIKDYYTANIVVPNGKTKPFTPFDLIEEISQQLTFNCSSKVLVFYTPEWGAYLHLFTPVLAENITVTTTVDNRKIAALCNMHGLKYCVLDTVVDQINKGEIMKFDVIVGNPPYQNSNGTSRLGSRGDTTLWDKFVFLGINCLVQNGYLALIHPNSWRKPEERFGTWKLLTKTNQMHRLVMSSGSKDQNWFNIGVRVDYYIVEKTPQYTTTKVTDHESQTHVLDLTKFNWLPNYAIDEISSMLGSGVTVLYNTFYHTQKDHSTIKDEKYQYPVVHTINKQGLGVRYFDKLPPDNSIHFGKPKVLLNQNERQYPVVDATGQYGMSQLTFGIGIDSETEGQEIVDFLTSDKGRRIIAATKWNTYYTDYSMFKSFKKDFYKC